MVWDGVVHNASTPQGEGDGRIAYGKGHDGCTEENELGEINLTKHEASSEQL